MMRTFLFYAIVALAAASLVGCGDNSTAGNPPTVDDIVGKWIIAQSYAVIKTTIHYSDSLPDSTYQRDTAITVSGTDNFAQFDSAMNYTIQTNPLTLGLYGPASGTGTWSLSGSLLRMISTSSGDTTDMNVGISGNNGVFVYNSTTIFAMPNFSDFRITRAITLTISAKKQ
jgi:hypothetical protein